MQEHASAFNFTLDISRLYRDAARETRTAATSLRAGDSIDQRGLLCR
jgi:hypothetical protein